MYTHFLLLQVPADNSHPTDVYYSLTQDSILSVFSHRQRLSFHLLSVLSLPLSFRFP
ncbi:hypothetical protein EVA_09927 [gut metagenome]|uniref:Uncharacterized protein n=1 Tax=gut metagenome TaxID=749906 RepID=J9GIZ4_9ZZZZ